MPGIEELNKFREEIASLGNERKIVEERGETYEELPLPQEFSRPNPEVSTVDVDDLLASIDADVSKQRAAGDPFDMLNAGDDASDPLAGGSSPDTDFSDIPLDMDFDKDAGAAPDSDSDLAALDAMLSSLPIGDAVDLQEPAEQAVREDLDASAPAPAADDSGVSFDVDDALEPTAGAEPREQEQERLPRFSASSAENETAADFDLDGFSMPDISDFSGLSDDPAPSEAAAFEDGGDALSVDDADVVRSDDSAEIKPMPEDRFSWTLEDENSDAPRETSSPGDASAGFAGENRFDGVPGADEQERAEGSSVEENPLPEISDADFDFGGFPTADVSDFSTGIDDTKDSGGFEPETARNAAGEAGDVFSLDDDLDVSLDSRVAPELGASGSPADNPEGAAFPAADDGFDADGFSMPDMPDMPDVSVGKTDDDAPAAPTDGEADGEIDSEPDIDFSFNPDLNASGAGDAHTFSADPAFTGLEGLDGLGDIGGLGDFSAPDGSAEAKPSGGQSSKKDVPTEISEQEFERFLSLLSRFPLNVRLAVEEYLSGDEGSDTQKMELVRNVLAGVPLRKIANALEKHLSRSISIPKDFEKKNFEEYELEKSSLKYVFFNKILPLAVITAIVVVLTACVVFLSYQFIYRPVSAEGLYKRGFQAIQEERYPQSMELFDQAVERWEKKRWYFTFARGYRDKNQYISAETIYTRLLDRFDNDLNGGLEYAEMLRSDLRNFEKAETILRRRVLDYHINNLDGLLLLGDVFLDWAEEDPEKYEQARIQYATAAEIYGRKDPVLVRMMRYFIRTNNLAEVLPLKDHFMGKRAEIGAADLIELGGYLLEKRYMPTAGDSDVLRDAIGDLRTILERGVSADPSIPEGHYNLGRFFIFNYQEEPAAVSLNEALRLFLEVRRVSPRRVVTNVDAYRLLGEIRAQEMEYMNARELYAAGISLYENRRAARSVPQDPRVGKLYADYADIDYFISNDWDSALDNYRKAVAELYDTPSVRYRIGYIHYQRRDYEDALGFFVRSYSDINDDANLLFSMGNTLFCRGSYNAARGYYERLMEMSEAERIRKGVILPQVRSDHGVFVEQYMHSANNLGVTLYNISMQTGRTDLQGRAYALFSESARAWDALTRNPDTMIRAQGSNLAYLNMRNISAPTSDFAPEIYIDIPKTLTGEKVLQSRVE